MARRVVLSLLLLMAVLASQLAVPPLSASASADDEKLVSNAYLGLLGRNVDKTGMTYWTGRLASGDSIPEVLAAIGDSDEQRQLVVRQAYVEILGREPDSGGLAYWSAGLIDWATERQLHAELYASEEFYRGAGGTNEAFVVALYEGAFGRQPDAAGTDYWHARLTGGTSRFSLARAFLALPEAALQPDLAVVRANPAPDTFAASVGQIDIVLDRSIEPGNTAVIVSVAGQRLPGTVTSTPDNNGIRFVANGRPVGIKANQQAPVVVTVFANDGAEVTRTDFGFTYVPGSSGGTLNELIVAFYGHAKTPVLGVMGEGTPEQAAQRLLAQAEPYRVDGRPVVPAFELIATLATAAPGERNMYSARTNHELIRPYLDAIRAVDGQLILDIQPGRADFVDEARFYHELLLEPEVGLALDPEWAVGPGETPKGNVGTVDAAEINEVSAYLSDLVIDNGLPDKLLVIHRFRPDMVTNTDNILSRPGVIILFQADGEGSPPPKIADYNTLLPDRFARGMKVFYDEDSPQMSPADVLALDPAPDYVSYQ